MQSYEWEAGELQVFVVVCTCIHEAQLWIHLANVGDLDQLLSMSWFDHVKHPRA